MIVNTASFSVDVMTAGDPEAERVAFVLPGRLDTKDYPHMRAMVALFADRGYFAVSFDPPGTWQSPGGLDQYTLHNYRQAVLELHSYFGGKPVVYAGHSFGGFMSMACSVDCKHTLACIDIMGASHFNRSSGVSKNSQWEQDGYLDEFRDEPDYPTTMRTFKLPWQFQQTRMGVDVRPQLAHLTVPKLFVYGEHDETIMPADVRDAYAAAADPKKLVGFDSDHDFRRNLKQVEVMMQVVANFLDENSL